MRRPFKLALVIALLFPHLTTADDSASLVAISKDPATVSDMRKEIRDAAAKGATRVTYPSGEWNWYCTTCLKLAAKGDFAVETFDGRTLTAEKLRKWLSENKVKAVQLSLALDLSPRIYFMIERILREQHVAYWIGSSDERRPKPGTIVIAETDGRVRAKNPDQEPAK